MSCLDVAKVTGAHLLFLGTSSVSWSISQFQDAARFARAHDVDSLLIKAADGGNWWYSGINGYRSIRDAIRAEGVGCIPYIYSYGDKYNYLDGEIGILKILLQEDRVVCADMEQEWNGQAAWASKLASALQNEPGIFLVSTWADPALQQWIPVIAALNPCVAAYMPQQYDNYLASCWQQFGQVGAACLQPTVSIQGVGPSDPVAIAKSAHDQGHTAISVWYYEQAVANPGLLDAIFAAFPKEETTVSIDLSSPMVANHFSQGTGGAWNCKNGYLIGGGILTFYKSFGGNAACGLTYLGLPLSNEIGIGDGRTIQRFERGVLCYDPSRMNDNPPGLDPSTQVYLAHIDSGVGEDPRVTDLQGQIAILQQELDASAQAKQIAALAAKIAQAVKDLS